MSNTIDPYLTEPDLVVLRNLFEDIRCRNNGKNEGPLEENHRDDLDIQTLESINDPTHPDFQRTIFTTWDAKNIPPLLNTYLIQPYARIATEIVRHPSDIVFLTHILLYLTINLPSALYLFLGTFTYPHALLHLAFTFWCTGPFTLMMHNHIHNNGVLKLKYSLFDTIFPYILEPIMGHTWDSYYYHHVKHHHVEGNGPEDLSSTIRYQRDSVGNFLCYVGRFVFCIWIELPVYFLRKGKGMLAVKSLGSEVVSMGFMAYMTLHVDMRAGVFVLVLPFVLLRFGLMVGNWGQHALVDEIEPDSDFRSSITLIDVPSNRFCFNDGYHTAHHLNPKRHWRDQPLHFLKSKDSYAEGRALVFHNIDYLMLTYRLLRKDYVSLAKCLVPIGEQIGMSLEEKVALLRTKTRAFTEEDVRRKFRRSGKKREGMSWRRVKGLVMRVLGVDLLMFAGLRKMGTEAKSAGRASR